MQVGLITPLWIYHNKEARWIVSQRYLWLKSFIYLFKFTNSFKLVFEFINLKSCKFLEKKIFNNKIYIILCSDPIQIFFKKIAHFI